MHKKSTRICPTCGGEKSAHAKQCRSCYHPIREPINNGDGTYCVPLTRNTVAIIDCADLPLVRGKNWTLNTHPRRPPYAARNEGGHSIYLHRVIVRAKPVDLVDHVNRNTLDCRRSNLRFATHQGNLANVPKRRKNTLFKGVRQRCDGQAWCARIQVNGQGIHLGSFPTPNEAAKAYDRAAIQFFGEFAGLNFPDEHEQPA